MSFPLAGHKSGTGVITSDSLLLGLVPEAYAVICATGNQPDLEETEGMRRRWRQEGKE